MDNDGTREGVRTTRKVYTLKKHNTRKKKKKDKKKTELEQWKHDQLKETSERYNPHRNWTEDRDPEYRRSLKVYRMSLLEGNWTKRNDRPESEPRYREWKKSTEVQRRTKKRSNFRQSV